jgi:hypothetical protein
LCQTCPYIPNRIAKSREKGNGAIGRFDNTFSMVIFFGKSRQIAHDNRF